MKMPDGGFRPAYNGQFIAEPASGIILGVAVDTSGSDHGWVKPMVEQVKERFGQTPKELLVDGGFSNAADIEWAAQPENGGIAVFMAREQEQARGRSLRAARARRCRRRRLARAHGERGRPSGLQDPLDP